MAKVLGSVLSKCCLLQTFPKIPLSRTIHMSSTKLIKVGEKIPDAILKEKDPRDDVNIAQLCEGKKVIIFGVPGAFTPFCTKTHLPSFLEHYSEFKKKGVNEIICVSVNDTFVMQAWGEVIGATGKIRMMSDPNAEFTKLLGLDLDIPILGGIRMKRFSMVLENGKVKILNVEPDGIGLTCSLAQNLIV